MFMNIFREGIPTSGRWLKNWFHDKKRRKRILVFGVMVMVVIWLVLCASMRLTVREPSFAEGDWGVMELGEQTVYEKVLMFFMIF